MGNLATSQFHRQRVMYRDYSRCLMCGSTNNLTLHHRIAAPVNETPANCVVLCMGPGSNRCTESASKDREDAYKRGLIVHHTHDPAQIPIHAIGVTWWLTHDGDRYSNDTKTAVQKGGVA